MSIAVLKISRKSVPFIIEKVRVVVLRMTLNPFYVLPSPPLADITAGVNRLESAYEDGLDGGRKLKALVRRRKREMLSLMSLLTAYVQNASGADESKIRSAGFDVKKAKSPVGILPPPVNVRSEFGSRAGEVVVKWNGVPKRNNYYVQMSTDPASESSWTNVPNGRTGRRKLTVTNLASGKTYWFRVFTQSTAGHSGPSDVTNHMAS